jgi:hypothetical protein
MISACSKHVLSSGRVIGLPRARVVHRSLQTAQTLAALSKEGVRPKITRIQAFQVDLPLHEKTYKWSGGKSVDVFDATVVKVCKKLSRSCWLIH